MGKKAFEKAVACPEALADFPDAIVNSLYFEGFGYPATSVYEAKTGSLPSREQPHPGDPVGQPWEEDEEDLRARFPRLWEKYGDSPAEPDGIDGSHGPGPPPSKPKPWWKFW